ncbi:hypothetical protein CPC08DRAFT_237567 [Agrocybe pediades]|nr:hypothetical protein CPC08DRAFT_237567 [Agrocybe pediades]
MGMFDRYSARRGDLVEQRRHMTICSRHGHTHAGRVSPGHWNAEDEITQVIRETGLLYSPESLLATYGSTMVRMYVTPHKFKNRTLCAAAIRSLSKFLCVSSQFCGQHHRLPIKSIETSEDQDVRGKIIIAL